MARLTKYTLDDLHKHAQSKGGLCLATEYTSGKVELKCANGHVWAADPYSIMSGHWCKKCSKLKAPDMSKLRALAIERGGTLVSDVYINNRRPLIWECGKGHRWEATWNSISNGTWCRICSRNIITFGEASVILDSLHPGGKCLTAGKFTSNANKHWKCEKGHVWVTNWNKIYNEGTWCPTCAGKSKPSLLDIDSYISDNHPGGVCASVYYKNCDSDLVFICDNNKEHMWSATWNNVRRGKWCPFCNLLVKEKQCRGILESLLGIKLEKKRFYFDTINTLRFYELDGYNEEMSFAFEYNGEQHYKFPHRFHKTEAAFLDLQQRDKDKAAWCKRNNICLLVIPYTEKNSLEKFIKQSLVSLLGWRDGSKKE